MTLHQEYFDRMYATSADPWSLDSRWYEQRKYAITMAGLSRPRYRYAFEPGCSVGVLSAQLATRCDSLLAADVAPAAVAATRARLADAPGAAVEVMNIPAQWPVGSFDLIVLSEVGYYLSPDDLDALVARAVGSLDRDAELCLVHWCHPVADYPMLGDEVHDRFLAEPGLRSLAHYDDPDFRLDLLTWADAPTPAQREGLV
ncbi:MAG TPA: SAM-dependent methyltransferase [Mycobacteriales bacterium]|nr:SAM-dependent methyltransferase [Mycobacteriales bacterium]HWB67209.1 SAM-dependent methyltransferase [Mycobacteriales bacterium]